MNDEIKLPSPTIVTLPKPHMELLHFEGDDPYPVFNRNHMHDFAREFARAAILADRAARAAADAACLQALAMCVERLEWHYANPSDMYTDAPQKLTAKALRTVKRVIDHYAATKQKG